MFSESDSRSFVSSRPKPEWIHMQKVVSNSLEVFIELFGRTDVGRLRQHNEDSFMVADLTTGRRNLLPEIRRHRIGSKGTILVVCDGMGGAAAGELASQTAVDTIYTELCRLEQNTSLEQMIAGISQSMSTANKRIFDLARCDASRVGMGTTCSLAAIFKNILLAAQVGDSRVYLIRGNQIVQVTRDQSLLNQLLETGQIEEKDIPNFQHSNVILQALGVVERVNPVFTMVELERDDVVLVCSDGLTGPLDDGVIKDIVKTLSSDLVEMCKYLTTKANDAGGPDNITVLAAQVRGSGLPSSGKEVTVVPCNHPT